MQTHLLRILVLVAFLLASTNWCWAQRGVAYDPLASKFVHYEIPPLGLTTRAKCVRVIDGDTLDVDVTYRVRVRLDDCWAPEKNTEHGKKAAEDLQAIALDRPCVLHVPTADAKGLPDLLTFGRVVGSVWLEGHHESLSEWQVRKGNASTEKGKPLGE